MAIRCIFHNRGVGRWSSWCGIFVGEDGVSPLSSKLRTFFGICPSQKVPRWWFQIFFIFTPTWGRFPFWLIFFRWVESWNHQLGTVFVMFRGGYIFRASKNEMFSVDFPFYLKIPCDFFHGWYQRVSFDDLKNAIFPYYTAGRCLESRCRLVSTMDMFGGSFLCFSKVFNSLFPLKYRSSRPQKGKSHRFYTRFCRGLKIFSVSLRECRMSVVTSHHLPPCKSKNSYTSED